MNTTAAAAPSRSTSAAAPKYALRVYNTLSKTKEPLETLQPGKVGIYLCGPTVYKPSHIGHMVGPIIFDSIKRYLTYVGYQVTWVVNITDVDDKLIAEASKRGMTMQAVAEEMTADYHRNLGAMGIDTIDHFPKATEHMAEIIDFTQKLIDRGFAYEAEGDVFFDVGRDREYGKLSGRSLEAMQGEGGGAAGRKKSSTDFALWKGAKPGEPSWKSPWGEGRPGWHIECSAMAGKILGESFDIHGGGLDLVFPHHENEVAQSECCHGKPLAKYWMHNGLMQATGESGKVGGRSRQAGEVGAASSVAEGDQAAQEAGKIGKSKGAAAFSELLKKYAGETIRFFLLSTHYRRPIDFSEERIDDVEKGLDQFYRFFERYKRVTGEDFYTLAAAAKREQGEFTPGVDAIEQAVAEHRKKFLEAMDDDFNTGGAIGDLFELVRLLNRFVDAEKLEGAGKSDAAKLAVLKRGASVMRELANTVGLFRSPVQKPGSSAGAGDELVGKLMKLFIEVRADARKNKNFATADGIRKGLAEIGVVLEDRPDGTSWSVQK
ncbi:MAG: cysteine--tRNA ligase [Planctomycetes bacterium]|nr:cysteine--tRNA ligase [Planctomycetota bacterium]